ncbi:hypothetical protein JTB14_028421 [Gonioctena quinquepunctata]|nr:hypothetical protein JTB14_028421 [Gonioctena quinquepunctata]
MDKKLKKEREAAKQTPSVAAASSHTEFDNYEDLYFSYLSSIESEEGSEQNSERFQETENILRKIAEEKNKKGQNTSKLIPAGSAGESHELPTKSNEEKREENKNPQNLNMGEKQKNNIPNL